jgi:hypothetical protein
LSIAQRNFAKLAECEPNNNFGTEEDLQHSIGGGPKCEPNTFLPSHIQKFHERDPQSTDTKPQGILFLHLLPIRVHLGVFFVTVNELKNEVKESKNDAYF